MKVLLLVGKIEERVTMKRSREQSKSKSNQIIHILKISLDFKYLACWTLFYLVFQMRHGLPGLVLFPTGTCSAPQPWVWGLAEASLVLLLSLQAPAPQGLSETQLRWQNSLVSPTAETCYFFSIVYENHTKVYLWLDVFSLGDRFLASLATELSIISEDSPWDSKKQMPPFTAKVKFNLLHIKSILQRKIQVNTLQDFWHRVCVSRVPIPRVRTALHVLGHLLLSYLGTVFVQPHVWSVYLGVLGTVPSALLFSPGSCSHQLPRLGCACAGNPAVRSAGTRGGGRVLI